MSASEPPLRDAAKPDVFLVGAPKCGTTSLFAWLSQHPEIGAPRIKEPHHFGSDLMVMPWYVRDRQAYMALMMRNRFTMAALRFTLRKTVWEQG